MTRTWTGSLNQPRNQFDLVVIGSGPAGQKGAIAAAKLGKRVAIIDKTEMIGGVCLHTGTIPSKTLREAILYLTGFRQRAFYGVDYMVKFDIAAGDLESRVNTVVSREMSVIRAQLRRNGATTYCGAATFIDPHTLQVESSLGCEILKADNVLVAVGTRPAHAPDIPCDGERVFDADQLSKLKQLPRDLIVVGAGVIGLEYASMMTALNAKVTVIDQRPTMLDFVDQEIIEALCYQMRRQDAVFRLGERVTGVEVDEQRCLVHAQMESGKRVHAQGLLYAVGRQANTDLLGLEAAGLRPDDRGRIKVNEHFQTEVSHIYAAGDCIGFPSLASTSMEQGRLAACHMFQGPTSKPYAFPYGIYTIPEISMIGKTERELTEAKIPYEVGIAKYEEIAKGQMIGDDTGMLKILFHPDTLKVLGVHVIGESATEIIHIGQTVMALDGTMEFFRDSVFNYPTFAEAYKIAAMNGLNKL
ncbi:MAG TPA: Si-specific NAD(P)(+) transhydrogenase [Blastocatellia bacterium]|nr:Si-specific NAD(P)(+) transhydrogenase [Blastocatellia bacterium]